MIWRAQITGLLSTMLVTAASACLAQAVNLRISIVGPGISNAEMAKIQEGAARAGGMDRILVGGLDVMEMTSDAPLIIFSKQSQADVLMSGLLENALENTSGRVALVYDTSVRSELPDFSSFEGLSTIVTTVGDDLFYAKNLIAPVTDKTGTTLEPFFNQMGLVSMVAAHLNDDTDVVGQVSPWASGQVYRAGIESGLVELQSVDGVEFGQAIRDVYAHASAAPASMFEHVRMASPSDAASIALARLAASTDCCDDGSCTWDERSPEIFAKPSFGVLGGRFEN